MSIHVVERTVNQETIALSYIPLNEVDGSIWVHDESMIERMIFEQSSNALVEPMETRRVWYTLYNQQLLIIQQDILNSRLL
jgi:hypothetical protein